MDRYTKKNDGNDSYYIGLEKNIPNAINRLAVFENIYEDIIKNQEKISLELEVLRDQGLKSSVKFRELMVKKLNNSQMLTTFKLYGVK